MYVLAVSFTLRVFLPSKLRSLVSWPQLVLNTWSLAQDNDFRTKYCGMDDPVDRREASAQRSVWMVCCLCFSGCFDTFSLEGFPPCIWHSWGSPSGPWGSPLGYAPAPSHFFRSYLQEVARPGLVMCLSWPLPLPTVLSQQMTLALLEDRLLYCDIIIHYNLSN